MHLLRNLAVAFSIYSRIPMPQFEWKEEDMKLNLVLLPFVGLVIGALEYLCFILVKRSALPDIFAVGLFSFVPLLVTGGFHVDGFIDTQDALRSYKPKEEKLKILEDPHIGAFAVISLVTYCCLWIAVLGLLWEKMDERLALSFGGIFVMSRILTGISSIVLVKAKKQGMLDNETKSSGKGCLAALLAELVVVMVLLGCFNALSLAAECAVLAIFFLYYRDRTKKEFGGITGDTAGYYLVMAELLMLTALAVCSWLPR